LELHIAEQFLAELDKLIISDFLEGVTQLLLIEFTLLVECGFPKTECLGSYWDSYQIIR
jgi:hypothetical protein